MEKEKFLIKEKLDSFEYSPKQKKLINEIKKINILRFKEVSDYHGAEHTQLVADFARYLAMKEGANVFEVEMAALLHDWGRVGENERRKKGVKVSHAEISKLKSQRLLLRQLLDEGEINSIQYQNILEMIKGHSDLPGGKMIGRKIIRDADRLSRFGVIGLHHLMLGAKDSGLPLYQAGRHILRPSQPKPERDVTCAIDDINYVIDWKNILETKTAKKLVEGFNLVEILREFLRTFAKYKDRIKNDDIWIGWVTKVANSIRVKRNELLKRFSSGNEMELFENLLNLEKAELFNENSLKEYLREYLLASKKKG